MITYDLEADGLYEESTKLHCICIKVDSEIFRFYDILDIDIDYRDSDRQLTRSNIFQCFFDNHRDNEVIICHNQFGYDIWMLRKFLDIDLIELFGYESLVDTFVWSQALHPDRELPYGCPTIIPNKRGAKGKRIGPHGLDSWAYRTGKKKPVIFDWTMFTNDMLIRCEEDVINNEAVYRMLLKERGDQ